MPVRICLRWLVATVLLALCACRPEAAPVAAPPQSPGADRPAQAVRVLTTHLRENDLAAFARDAVTPDLQAPLDAAWRDGRTHWPLDELPLGKRVPDMLAALSTADAERHFRTLFDQQFAHAGGELRSTAATLGLFAIQYLRTEHSFSDDERGHYTQLVAAVGRWAATAPLSDPARAHAAIPPLVKAARATGLASAADFRRLGMQESLTRLSPFSAEAKRQLAGYGLDIDAGLAAMDITLQSQTGDTARVRMRYALGGQPIDTVVDVERHDGRWYVSDFLRHAKAAVAPATATPPATPAPSSPPPSPNKAAGGAALVRSAVAASA